MTTQFDGRLVFPGGRQEAKPFFKEMKKLRADWVVATSRKYRKLRVSTWKWAGLADEVIDVLIACDTERTMTFILGLAHARDEAYMLALNATQIMDKYGARFYSPGGDGTRDPRSFADESQEFMSREMARQEQLLSPPVSSKPAPDAERDKPAREIGIVEWEFLAALSFTEFTRAIYDITQGYSERLAKEAPAGDYRPSHWVSFAHERLVSLTAKELKISDTEAAEMVDRAYLNLKPPELEIHPLDWARNSDDSEAVDTFFLVATLQIAPSSFEPYDPSALDTAPHVASAMIAATLKTPRDPTGAKRLGRLAELQETGAVAQDVIEGIEARIKENKLSG